MRRLTTFKSLILLALIGCTTLSFAAEGKEEHVVWNKRPISFEIPLGSERIINFSEPVTLKESELTSNEVALSIHNGAVYIKSLDTFEPKRAEFVLSKSGQVVIVDVASSERFKDGAMLSVLTEQENTHAQAPFEGNQQSLNYVSLTRFAIQSLYSPERLLEMPNGIVRAPMYTHKTVSLVYGDKVIARPLISWSGGGLFVTAVMLKNKLSKEVVLDPRSLIGQWQTATFYPSNKMSAQGALNDSVTVFVTSSLPFGKALTQLKEV